MAEEKKLDILPDEAVDDLLMTAAFVSGVHVGAYLARALGIGGAFEATGAGDSSLSHGLSKVSLDDTLTATSPLYALTQKKLSLKNLATVFSPGFAAIRYGSKVFK